MSDEFNFHRLYDQTKADPGITGNFLLSLTEGDAGLLDAMGFITPDDGYSLRIKEWRIFGKIYTKYLGLTALPLIIQTTDPIAFNNAGNANLTGSLQVQIATVVADEFATKFYRAKKNHKAGDMLPCRCMGDDDYSYIDFDFYVPNELLQYTERQINNEDTLTNIFLTFWIHAFQGVEVKAFVNHGIKCGYKVKKPNLTVKF